MIRDYRPEDLPEVMTLFARSVRELGCRDYSPAELAAWAPDRPDARAWAKRLASEATFVCERDGRIAGLARVGATGCVDLLYVHPDFERRGVARELMGRVTAWARARHIGCLHAAVSLTARPFFEKAGFRVVADQTAVRNGVSLRNFRMERPIEEVRLRPAGPGDAALLRRWDEQAHVLAADPNDDWQWESELARSPDWREQLIAEVDGRPIGFLEIIDPAREDGRYWGEVPAGLRAVDIWIGEAQELGKGYGTQMMTLALARCFADPHVRAVLVDPLASNTRAHRFYERLGFRFVERRRFGRDDCFVYRLDRRR
jgi:aminoglycoside 6'-N-acetyltransferase